MVRVLRRRAALMHNISAVEVCFGRQHLGFGEALASSLVNLKLSDMRANEFEREE